MDRVRLQLTKRFQDVWNYQACSAWNKTSDTVWISIKVKTTFIHLDHEQVNVDGWKISPSGQSLQSLSDLRYESQPDVCPQLPFEVPRASSESFPWLWINDAGELGCWGGWGMEEGEGWLCSRIFSIWIINLSSKCVGKKNGSNQSMARSCKNHHFWNSLMLWFQKRLGCGYSFHQARRRSRGIIKPACLK